MKTLTSLVAAIVLGSASFAAADCKPLDQSCLSVSSQNQGGIGGLGTTTTVVLAASLLMLGLIVAGSGSSTTTTTTTGTN